MDVTTAHCRLCADVKSCSKLVNLAADEHNKSKTLEKLHFLGLDVHLDSIDDILPKTVCLLCIDLLDKAFDFVTQVEAAQNLLKQLALDQQIKEEVLDDRAEVEIEKFEYDESIVKDEKSSDNGADTPIKTYVNNHKKTQSKDPLDVLPLSQLKLTWKDYNWLCAYCDTIFPTVDELKAHSVQYHGCCNPFKCTDCNRRKLTLDSFIIHVKRHRKYLQLSCYKCHIKFSKPYDAKLHKNVHADSEFRCRGCNETFASKEEAFKHVSSYKKGRKLHNPPVDTLHDNLTCLLCQKSFKNKGTLKLHLEIHTERKRDYTCEVCGKCFFNKHNLAGHMMLHEDKRPHQCEICQKRFRTRSQLRSHIGIHNGIKPFSCEQCGRQFRLQKHLSAHSIIHTDALPYKCTYCDKSFKFRTILQQHLRQHTGLKPYKCDICERDFTNWPNYNKHMKRRHGMDMAKKKYTPDGILPINPSTGEVIPQPKGNKAIEWMKTLLEGPRGRGRRKIKSDDSKTKSTDVNS